MLSLLLLGKLLSLKRNRNDFTDAAKERIHTLVLWRTPDLTEKQPLGSREHVFVGRKVQENCLVS